MIVYIYDGKMFCEACGPAIVENVIKSGLEPEEPCNPWSYGSDKFPKGPYVANLNEGAEIIRCGSGTQCLDARPPAVVGSCYNSGASVEYRDPWTDIDKSLLLEEEEEGFEESEESDEGQESDSEATC